MESLSYKVEQLPGPVCQLGEGPIWDVDSQSLYYVDALGAAILRFDYNESETYRATIDGLAPISFIFLVEGRPGEFVLGTGIDLSLVSWDGKSTKATLLRKVASLALKGVKPMRFNDGKVDRFGRLYAGTMLMEGHGDVFEEREGKLYRFDGKFGGSFIQQKDGIGISNGITWNEQSGVLYYVDSCTFDVKVFQVNAAGDYNVNSKCFMTPNSSFRSSLVNSCSTSRESSVGICAFSGISNVGMSKDVSSDVGSCGKYPTGSNVNAMSSLTTSNCPTVLNSEREWRMMRKNCRMMTMLQDLENEEVLIDISNNGENPGFVGDGMTNDTEGNLYLAAWCGSKVLKIDVKKRAIVQEIGLPVTQVTSVAFGGPRLDELFVTSAATDVFDGTEGLINRRPPGSGKVFRISGLGVKGQGMNKIVLNE
ncbi:regucalcin-like [Sabethes cyaneus]|uniref:regucalcin-like n=1 Tax=Sabethes cyaneus TaxID=53552 RepID=UPI00237EA2B5|nr:regucalcin-like [Sabethes cyaneus]